MGEEMIQMTYKEFFEKAKSHSGMQNIIIQCFVTATKMVLKANSGVDVGDLVLNSLSTMTEVFNEVKLVGKDEITAEYMAEVLNKITYKDIPKIDNTGYIR